MRNNGERQEVLTVAPVQREVTYQCRKHTREICVGRMTADWRSVSVWHVIG